jgi:hypothetical protein
MHCDVCLDRLPKLPALMMLSPSSMQDRFLEFGASACLPKLPELSLTTQGFLSFLPVLVSQPPEPLTFS